MTRGDRCGGKPTAARLLSLIAALVGASLLVASAKGAVPPTGPAGPSQQARSDLAALIDDVGTATAVSYATRDSTGATVDTIKVIALPAPSSYLGVYQDMGADGRFTVRLATSTDLLHWTYRATLARDASQPYIAAVPGGGYLLAIERNVPPLLGLIGTDTSHLELRYYASAGLLLSDVPAEVIDMPNELSPQHEGTPSISSIALAPSAPSLLGSLLAGPLAGATITIGFHYYDAALGADRNAVGTLTGLGAWSEQVDTTLNDAFPASIRGDIGARDTLTFEGYPFTVVEGQSVPGRFGDFRIYLYDPTANYLQLLQPLTAAPGSLAFGNPKLTLLTDPAGEPALLVSLYVFSQRSAPGQAGPLLYYHEL